MPRLVLMLLCLAYLLPGFVGRGPWKGADLVSYGYMAEMAQGNSSWWLPSLMGIAPEVHALLPYWLGAWMIQIAPHGLAPDLAVRLPFIALLAVALSATWYGTYYLARSSEAQPVPFAFGGEAQTTDYARAMADGGLLAFMACLGLAQLSHESTPALAQLCFTALFFYAIAALPYQAALAPVCSVLGLLGLSLSGAPFIAVLLGLGCALIYLFSDASEEGFTAAVTPRRGALGLALLTLAIALLSTQLHLWRWLFALPEASWSEWRSLARLLLWFTWPAWPLALWTIWRWRGQLLRAHMPGRHLALPLWFAGVAIAATFTTASADRSLLLGLPALAALAAFALPTWGRSMAALVDWFTLIFFSSCAIVIWVVWIALQTGVPKQPADNVARLAPGFEHSFSALPFLVALGATLAWVWLVHWRVGRHRSAIWKSLVLPASGAALSWLLLMTLWLPLLDFARSYKPLVTQSLSILPTSDCVEALGLKRGQIAALKFQGHIQLAPLSAPPRCEWLIVDNSGLDSIKRSVDLTAWVFQARIKHPADPKEDIQVYKRQTASSN